VIRTFPRIGAMTERADLDTAAVNRVLRRASEASNPSCPLTGSQGMSEEAVLAAALEAGLPEEAVRLALAEERLPAAPTPSRVDRMLGAVVIGVDRSIAMRGGEVLRRLDSLLAQNHGMRRNRSGRGFATWSRRSGTLGALHRSVQRARGEAGLSRVDEISAYVTRLDDRGALVRLIASRRQQRKGNVASCGGVGVAAAGVTGGAALVFTPLALVGLPLAAAAGASMSSIGRKQARQTAVELERLLDDVQHDVEPAGLVDGVRRLLRGG
jgi:hypothetical protein